MTGSASNQLRSAFVAEVTEGTTPATPAFVNCDFPIQMSATPSIIENRTINYGGARGGASVGDITVEGSMSGPMIYGNFDVWLETLMQGAWATNVLKDAKLSKTVTVENAIQAGVGGANTMMRYRGVQATEATLSLTSNAEIQLSMSLMGRAGDVATVTAITGATYTSPTNVLPLTSSVDVGTIIYAGYTLDCFESSTINFAFEGRERQTKIGTNELCGITRGAFLPTISSRIYVEANFMAMYNAARVNHATFAVTYPLGSVSGSKYTLLFPKCTFASATLDFTGSSAMQDVQILPQYNTASACVLQITRAVV